MKDDYVTLFFLFIVYHFDLDSFTFFKVRGFIHSCCCNTLLCYQTSEKNARSPSNNRNVQMCTFYYPGQKNWDSRASAGAGAWSVEQARACSLTCVAVSIFLARVVHVVHNRLSDMPMPAVHDHSEADQISHWHVNTSTHPCPCEKKKKQQRDNTPGVSQVRVNMCLSL